MCSLDKFLEPSGGTCTVRSTNATRSIFSHTLYLDPVLLSLVDETASHARSLSEPSLPPPTATTSRFSPSSTSLPVFHPSPESTEDRSVSTPALPSPVPTASSTTTSSSLFHPAHNVYGTRPHLFPVTIPDDPYPAHPASDMGPWQMENSVWNTPADRFPAPQADSFPRQPPNYPIAGYDSSGFHDNPRSARSMDPSLRQSPPFGTEYYDVQGLASHKDLPSSLSMDSHLSLEADNSPTLDLAPQAGIPLSPFDSFNNTSYPILQQPSPRGGYGNASMSYGIEPYQGHFSTGAQLQQTNPAHTLGIAGSASYDVVDPDFLSDASHIQPQWVRPPATFPRSPDASEQRRSPEM